MKKGLTKRVFDTIIGSLFFINNKIGFLRMQGEFKEVYRDENDIPA